jgi:hypothetical protein
MPSTCTTSLSSVGNFFGALDNKGRKALNRSAVGFLRSTVSGTLFVYQNVQMFSGQAAPEKQTGPCEPYIYYTLAFMTFVSFLDAWVHFMQYNHKNYRKPFESSGVDLLAQFTSNDSSKKTPCKDTCCHKHTQETHNKGAHNKGSLLKQKLLQSPESYQPLASEDTGHIAITVDSSAPSKQEPTNALIQSKAMINFFAAVCTFSCSLDDVSAPALVVTAFRLFRILPEEDATQRVVILLVEGVFALNALWNSASGFDMAKYHLENPDDHAASCCGR